MINIIIISHHRSPVCGVVDQLREADAEHVDGAREEHHGPSEELEGAEDGGDEGPYRYYDYYDYYYY